MCVCITTTTTALGTSVGSGALSLKHAVILGGIFEFLGTMIMGGFVSSTLKVGIVDPDDMAGSGYFAIGMISSLISATVLLILATLFSLPVSTTQTITGGIIGFGLVAQDKGASVDAMTIVSIIISWVATPIISTAMGYLFYLFIDRKILSQRNADEECKKYLPYITGLTIASLMSFLYTSVAKTFSIPLYYMALVFAVSFVVTVIVIKNSDYILGATRIRQFSFLQHNRQRSNSTTPLASSPVNYTEDKSDPTSPELAPSSPKYEDRLLDIDHVHHEVAGDIKTIHCMCICFILFPSSFLRNRLCFMFASPSIHTLLTFTCVCFPLSYLFSRRVQGEG